jgi:hypothetical protein
MEGLEQVPMLPPEPFDESMLPMNHNDNKTSPVIWSYEPVHRIVRVDFTKVPANEPLPAPDLAHVARLMQSDDLVVITKGLTMKLEETEIDSFFDYLGGSQRMFYSFRRFQRSTTDPHHYDEMDGHVAMTHEAFVSYLKNRMQGVADATVTFLQPDESTATVGVHDVLLYMIDAKMPKLCPLIEKLYRKKFRWSAIYPGGSLCMMKDLPKQMHPFMGPNLYVAPGSIYTSLRQEGLGTVDSGHTNLFGMNEVRQYTARNGLFC